MWTAKTNLLAALARFRKELEAERNLPHTELRDRYIVWLERHEQTVVGLIARQQAEQAARANKWAEYAI